MVFPVLLALLLVSALLYFAWDRSPPRIEVEERAVDSEGRLRLVLRITDESGVGAAYALIRSPGGWTVNKTLLPLGQNCFALPPTPLGEEGEYFVAVAARDGWGNAAEVAFSVPRFDDPRVEWVRVRYDYPYLYLNASISDLGGVGAAVVAVGGESYALAPIAVDERGRGVYGVRIRIDPSNSPLSFKVYAFDKFNRSSSAEGRVNFTLRERFLGFAVSRGFSAGDAGRFLESHPDLVESLYPGDRAGLQALLSLYLRNSSMLEAVKGIVYRDSRVGRKNPTLVNLAQSLLDLNEGSLSRVSLNFLGNLTACRQGNPAAVFGREAVWRALNLTEKHPVVATGLSGKQPVACGEAEILLYIVNDNPRDAEEYPYAAWALAKQAGAIGRWLVYNATLDRAKLESHPEIIEKLPILNYTQEFDVNGTKYSMRNLINKVFPTLTKYTREGKMFIGLKPEELLAFIPENHPNRLEIVDNLMRQKVLPQALFYTIWPKACFAWEIYSNFANPWQVNNGPCLVWFEVLNPGLALKIATDNIDWFDEGYKATHQILENPNMRLSDMGTARDWMDFEIHVSKRLWPNIGNESEKDWLLLFNKGSNIAKANLLIYMKSIADRTKSPYSRFEEVRVEQCILNAYSHGLPVFRSHTAWISSGLVDGMPSVLLKPSDIALLYQRSPDEILLNNKTYTLNLLSTRKPAVIKDFNSASPDSLKTCGIWLPDLTWYIYLDLRKKD